MQLFSPHLLTNFNIDFLQFAIQLNQDLLILFMNVLHELFGPIDKEFVISKCVLIFFFVFFQLLFELHVFIVDFAELHYDPLSEFRVLITVYLGLILNDFYLLFKLVQVVNPLFHITGPLIVLLIMFISPLAHDRVHFFDLLIALI